MPKSEFGFTCGKFSLAPSGDGILLPGSKNQPIFQRIFPYLELNDAAGLFNVKVESGGRVVGNFPIQVLWVPHTSQPQSFIGFRPTMMPATQLREGLQHLVDSEVSFTLTPLESEAGQGKN